MKKIICSLFLLVFFLSFIGASEWWDSDWDYKKQINVTETSGNALTNYSTLLYINYTKDTSSHANANFSDLRFLNSTEDGELNYWIENKTDSSFAWVWIKIPSLTASSNETIYMYYGNSEVNTTSNIKTAFLLGDDFNDASIDTNLWDTFNTPTETSGYLEINANGEGIYSDITINQTMIMKSSIFYTGGSGYLYSFGGTTDYSSSGTWKMLTYPASYLSADYGGTYMWLTVQGYGTPAGASRPKILKNVWNKHEIILDGTNTIGKLNGTQFDTTTTGYTNLQKIIFGNSGYTLTGTARMDYVIVRAYASSEPTYVLGEEESQGTSNTAPTYSDNQTNSTTAGSLTKFSILFDDDTALNSLGQYIFSTNNTGTWSNESAVNFTATPSWANVTKTLNSTEGNVISYMWYGTDNASNMVKTDTYSLTTPYSSSIKIERIYPTGNINVTQNEFFNVTLNITCLTGTCGTINVSLDPEIIIFNDTFTEASTMELDEHTPDVGIGWIELTQTGTSDIVVSGGNGYTIPESASASTNVLYIANATYSNANYIVEVNSVDVDNADDYQIVAARVQDSNNMYVIEWTDARFILYKKVAGSWSTLDTASSPTIADNDIIKLEVIGTSIKGYVNDAELVSAIDSSHSLAGYAGIGVGNLVTADGDTSSQKFDNFIIKLLDYEKSGLIPIESDWTTEPFYTNATSNPLTTSSLSEGQSELVTFYTNATGEIDITHNFFAFANETSYPIISNSTTNWNVTIIATPSLDTCTYTSGDWFVECSDNCFIDSNTNIGGNNLILNGTGYFFVEANITEIGSIDFALATDICSMVIGDGVTLW